MIPDLTNPYLSNGSLSPSARTVSVPADMRLFKPLSFILSHSAKREKKERKLSAVRKSSLCTARPPYSLRVASQGVLTTSLFFFGGDIRFCLPPTLGRARIWQLCICLKVWTRWSFLLFILSAFFFSATAWQKKNTLQLSADWALCTLQWPDYIIYFNY